MKSIMTTSLAVAVVVTFSAPSFADKAMKGSHLLVYGEE
jgi:hypothetical protein